MIINIDKLSEQCKKTKSLFNVLFVLLSSCNQNCIHCYIPEHNEFGLKLNKIKKIVKQARELGALNITLTGGEIFVRKDIFDIISYAKSQHLRVFLMSNASLINEKDIIQLHNLGIAEFSTTLFSMDAKIHDKITQLPGSWDKTYNNILLLKKYGIPVTVKTPLMEINKYDYKEVEKFASQNGFNFITTTTIFTKTDGDDSPHDLKIKSEAKTIIKETRELLQKYRSEELSYEKSGIPCGAGFNSITINYDGTVWPCNSLLLPVGNINNESLKEIWENSKSLNQWRAQSVLPLQKCIKCKLKNKCLRCPGMALLEDGDLYGCSSSAKEIAEIL